MTKPKNTTGQRIRKHDRKFGSVINLKTPQQNSTVTTVNPKHDRMFDIVEFRNTRAHWEA